MALIDNLIDMPYTSSEMVTVIRKEKYEKPNGSEAFLERTIGEFKVNVQPLGTVNKVEGLTLETEVKGADIKEVWGMYSHNYNFQVGDIVIRPSDNLRYEIKSAEQNGVGTILEFQKCLIVKMDNQ